MWGVPSCEGCSLGGVFGGGVGGLVTDSRSVVSGGGVPVNDGSELFTCGGPSWVELALGFPLEDCGTCGIGGPVMVIWGGP